MKGKGENKMIKQLIVAPELPKTRIPRFAAKVNTVADDGTPIMVKFDIHYFALMETGEIKPVIYSENGIIEIFNGEIHDRG